MGGFDIQVPTAIETVDYIPILALGMVCALGGIAIMRGVTEVETLFRRSRLPVWLRPMLGGLIVGLLSLISPIVLGRRSVTDPSFPSTACEFAGS